MKVRNVAIGLGVLALAGGSLVLFNPSLSNAAPTSVIVSTPAAHNGWATQDGAPTYVYGPVGADGNGSVRVSTPNPSSKVNYFHIGGVPLSGVSGLSYMLQNSGGPQASYQMQIHTLGHNVGTFTSLVWEPYQQPGHGGEVIGDGTWHSFTNLETGLWWSSHPIPGDPTSSGANQVTVPLSTIQAANPTAWVELYGLSQGSNNANSVSFVDDLSFNGTTTNFEMNKVATRVVAHAFVVRSGGPYGVTFPHNLSARLTVGLLPIGGATITFYAGPYTQCTAQTNFNGTATCTPSAGGNLVILYGGYTAKFAGDATYLPSSGRGGLIGN
jgi:hypothetical protein